MSYDMLLDELEHRINIRVSGSYERSLIEAHERRVVEEQLIETCVQKLAGDLGKNGVETYSDSHEKLSSAYQELVQLRVGQKMHDSLFENVVADCREFLESANPSDYWTSTMVERLLEFSREYSADVLKHYQLMDKVNKQSNANEFDPFILVEVLWAKTYEFLRYTRSNRKRRQLYMKILTELEGREMEKQVDYEN